MTATLRARPDEPRPWPFQPYVDHVAAHLGIAVHPTAGPCPGCHGAPTRSDDTPICLTQLGTARYLGIDPKQIHRWHHTGLTDHQADHLAIRIRTHPARIWGDAWRLAGLTPLDELYLYGTPTAEPGWRTAAGYPLPARAHAGHVSAA